MTVYYPLGPYIFGPKPNILPRPYIFKDRIFYFSGPYILLSYHEIIGRSNVGEACWWKMYVGEKPVCWWNLKFFPELTFHQHTEKVSPTYFTNIHLVFCSNFSLTYSSFHQHTENFSPTNFTNIHINFCLHQHTASPTYRKFFTNILFFTNIFHQHHYSRLKYRNVANK